MYKKAISILGKKGGSGKSTTSHMLALGLSKLGIRAILLTTDTDRKSLKDGNRPYSTFGAQTAENLKKALEAFGRLDASTTPSVLIVDGGGNREGVDNLFAEFSDLILLPFRESEEDIRVVSADLQRLPEAMALPTCWTTNNFASESAKKVIDEMESKFPGRVMQPVISCRASQKLLAEDFTNIDTQVVSISKALAEQAMNKLGINIYQK